MARDGKCPRCNHKGSIIDFLEAAGEGRLLVIFKDLPKDVQNYFLNYLSLFRPKSGCAIQQLKVERLTRDLADLVAHGYVHVQGQVDRSCPPHIWAMAMEQMIEQAVRLNLPIKNHNYLKSIAWDLADRADSKAEKQQSAAAKTTRVRAGTGADPDVYDPEKIKEEYHRKMQVERSQSGGKVDLSNVIKGLD